MSQITLTSPFQALVNTKLFHRSHVRTARTQHCDAHLPARSSAGINEYELTMAQARLFTALR